MELSEAFYAGLSLVDTDTLKKASQNKEAFVELYDVAVQNFAGLLSKMVKVTLQKIVE